MTYIVESVRQIGGRVADGSTVGSGTWTKVNFAGSMGRRSGIVLVCDPQETIPGTCLYVLCVNRGSAASGLTLASAVYRINSGQTPTRIPWAETVDVYVQASSANTPYSGYEEIV